MSRTGDLMQRESLLRGQGERDLTNDMVKQLGQAMEDISRATGAVAHFYKTLDMADTGSSATIDFTGNEVSFQALIDEVGSVQRVGGPAQPVEESKEERKEPAQPAPQVPARRSLDDMPDPLEQALGLFNPQMMVAIMMGNYPALDPFPPKARQHIMR